MTEENSNTKITMMNSSLIEKYSLLRAFIIFSLLFEFIYLGFWIVPFKIKLGQFYSILVLVFNAVIIIAVLHFFEMYKKIVKPLIAYSPKDDSGKIDTDYIAKVNDFRKNVNLVISVESILISFSSILFFISFLDNNFFKNVSDQLKYLSLGTIAPMILFALKAENSLDEIYWRYNTEDYKSHMETVLVRTMPKELFYNITSVIVLVVVVLFVLWFFKLNPTWWLWVSSVGIALGLMTYYHRKH